MLGLHRFDGYRFKAGSCSSGLLRQFHVRRPLKVEPGLFGSRKRYRFPINRALDYSPHLVEQQSGACERDPAPAISVAQPRS